MSSTESEQVQRHMGTLNDHALMRLVALEQWNYRREAIAIARDELRRRGLPALTREEYWTRFPSERIGPDGFCDTCRAATTDESPGSVAAVQLIGTRLLGHSNICPACQSILQRKWVCFGLPLIPLSKYRIIYLESGPYFSRFLGRKLRIM